MKNVYKFLEVDDTFKLKRKFNNFNKGGHFKENIFTKIIFQPSTLKNIIKKFIKPTLFLKIIISKIRPIFLVKSQKKIDAESLKLLKKNIEDDKGNVTRFLIMGKNIEQPEYDKNKNYITSCIFRVKSEPSALISVRWICYKSSKLNKA